MSTCLLHEVSSLNSCVSGLKQANLESESSVAEAKDDLSHLESRLLALQDQIAFTTEGPPYRDSVHHATIMAFLCDVSTELKHAEAEARSLDERLVLTREENAKVLADHQLEREGLAVVLQRLSVGSESKRSCEYVNTACRVFLFGSCSQHCCRVEVTTLTEAVEAATAVKVCHAITLMVNQVVPQ